ncbi:type IV toxin-antitoxin system AbiEi family antitoxin domain-containing protein [Pseudarthrobacter sp. BIM B-2242]|uniref:type IV toxin-antitoxin system AbiEi family antitoxin domain-containing protein n=1 Tax=Pseudarthrobacter sp. BIM B-2242 TaxID=2772401 RepID=UPI001CC5D303
MTVLPKLVLTRDLASLGVSTRQLPAAVRAGALVRIRQGVYVDAAAWKGLQPWDQYRVRIEAAAETCPASAGTWLRPAGSTPMNSAGS